MQPSDPAMNTPTEEAAPETSTREVTPGPEGETPDTFRNDRAAPAPEPGTEA